MDIGAKIKELRKQRGITQERLAEYLNISPQAVSKWEIGTSLPDITFLPKLAMFFDVSADELLSLDQSVTDKRIAAYKKQADELFLIYDYDGYERLMERALEEYPSNYEFMLNLVHAMSHTRKKEKLGKRIALCERIIEDCRNETIRSEAIKHLCMAYKANAQMEAALNLINTLPNDPLDKNILLELALSGEEKCRQAQKNLLYSISRAVHKLIMLSSNGYMGKELSIKEKIRFAEAALAVNSVVFYEGHKSANNGNFRHIYERLAELYLCESNVETGMKYLRLAAESSEAFDRSVVRGDKYDSVFVGMCSHPHNEQYYYIDSTRLAQLMEQRPAFDDVRETDEFKGIYFHLKNVTEEIKAALDTDKL